MIDPAARPAGAPAAGPVAPGPPLALAVLGVANLIGAAVVFVYLNDVLAVSPAPGHARTAAAVFAVYMCVTIPVGTLTAIRAFAPVNSWLAAGTAPDAKQQRAVFGQPLRQAALAFAYWVGAAAVFGLLGASFGETAVTVTLVGCGVLLGGLATCALCYLMLERGLRPVFAQALAGGPPSRPLSLGVRSRLLLGWTLGSGIPLLGLALLPAGHRRQGVLGAGGPVLFLAATGLVLGFVMLAVATGTVSRPLVALRRALEEVEAGRTDVAVPVDDGGEIGQVQAGFNRMVLQLQERQRLRDLFGRHVGEEVARLALSHGVRLGGERREASVLFVDLIGSTTLAEMKAPEAVVATLNAMFAAVVTTASRHGGWVNKFEGDGALCVFGAPVGDPDHAVHALRAARDLRRSFVALAAEHPDLDVAVGVSSGSVVAGNIGAEARFEYTVIGDPVNEAARLTEEAKRVPGRVLAAEVTVTAAGQPEAGVWAPCPSPLELRGRRRPTRAFRPAGD